MNLDRKKFAEGMAILCEMYHRQPSDLLLKGYYLVLKDLTVQEFNQAIANTMATHTFSKMPLPAEIRNQVKGNPEDQAIIALDTLEKAMGSQGKYRSVAFEDPVIQATVSSMGGWIKICSIEPEEWKWQRKEFVKIYKPFSARPAGQLQIPDHLPGIVETTNSANGYNEQQPVIRIGGGTVHPQIGSTKKLEMKGTEDENS